MEIGYGLYTYDMQLDGGGRVNQGGVGVRQKWALVGRSRVGGCSKCSKHPIFFY